MAEMVIVAGDGSRRRVALDRDRSTIGRSRESDIFLPDQWLSRHHAEVRAGAGGHVLVDLGSKNGTLLNGERLDREQLLREGDVITLGEHRLTYEAGPRPEEDAEAPEGTRVFSARELSDAASQPAGDPEALARQNRLLSILRESAEQLIEHRPLGETFERILDLLFRAVPAERGAVLLLEGAPPVPVIKASKSRKGTAISHVSRSIARHVLAERVSMILPNLMEDAAFRAQDSILQSGIRSALCAPLLTPGGAGEEAAIGLVYLDTLQRAHSFGEDDLTVVTALARVAAAKIQTERLLEERLEKRRLEEDMRVAAEIQRALLPSAPPTVPGYELVGSNRPCRTVGGDYFDFALDGTDLLLALADVSGKGSGAALLMAILRAAVRAHWRQAEVAAATAAINETICQNITPGRYVTFFQGRLQPASGRLAYVNAGHNPPLLVRADGSIENLTEGGMVLGLVEGTPFARGEAELRPGDCLLVFSDGVTETWNGAEEEFGEERLAEVARRSRGLGAAALEAEVLGALEAFAGGTRIADDRTLVVLKRQA